MRLIVNTVHKLLNHGWLVTVDLTHHFWYRLYPDTQESLPRLHLISFGNNPKIAHIHFHYNVSVSCQVWLLGQFHITLSVYLAPSWESALLCCWSRTPSSGDITERLACSCLEMGSVFCTYFNAGYFLSVNLQIPCCDEELNNLIYVQISLSLSWCILVSPQVPEYKTLMNWRKCRWNDLESQWLWFW